LLADIISGGAPGDLQDFAARSAADLGVRVTLIDQRGVVMADSAKDSAGVRGMDNHLGRPEVRDARLRGSGENLRRSATTNVRYFYCARLVEGAGPVRYVRLAVSEAQIRTVVSDFVWIVSVLSFVVLLALALGAYAGLRRLSKPAERIAAAAQAVAGGNLEAEAPVVSTDELGRVAQAVNEMKRSLRARIAELEGEHALLGSVVTDMKEGLLAVGPDRRIRLANNAAREIFDLPFDPSGRLLAEVVRHPDVMRVIETAVAGQLEQRERIVELPGSGRSFELHVTPLGSDRGVVALLFDVTRLEALERVRREFVANVSHELRTPLTSIKAFVETLTAGNLDDREQSLHFLRIIEKHTDRMEALINDITDLSRIETGAVTLRTDTVDVGRLVRDIVDHLAPAIVQYEVRVDVELPEPFRLRVDRRRFEQVLTNLIDNAIKFNRPAGTVRIHGGTEQGRPRLVVEDTGIGIPSDSVEKIFHRFYRVDAARSREAGGTGLGLAIVKHLMRLHGGRVRVESELGVGSRFVLELPAETLAA